MKNNKIISFYNIIKMILRLVRLTRILLVMHKLLKMKNNRLLIKSVNLRIIQNLQLHKIIIQIWIQKIKIKFKNYFKNFKINNKKKLNDIKIIN